MEKDVFSGQVFNYPQELLIAMDLFDKIKEVIKILKPGEYRINDKVYFIIQEYKTVPSSEKSFEYHKDEHDICIGLKGRELVYVRKLECREKIKFPRDYPYDEKRDTLILKGRDNSRELYLNSKINCIELSCGNYIHVPNNFIHMGGIYQNTGKQISDRNLSYVKRLCIKIPDGYKVPADFNKQIQKFIKENL